MKIALIHDWFTSIGGGEKVLENIFKIFKSEIYCLLKNKKIEKEIFGKKVLKTSFLQNCPFALKYYRYLLPLMPSAIESFNLRNYDLLISSSSSIAKGVLKNKNQLHICYCHSPMRYIWDLSDDYLKLYNFKNYRRILAEKFIKRLRVWDLKNSENVDFFLCNSNFVKKRISKIYKRDAKVIYPPVRCDFFSLYTKRENFYLTVSRLVRYKRVDLIIKAFNDMPEKELIIIGEGPDFKFFSKMANKNIKFLNFVDDSVLKYYMQRAKAFIYAAIEDFGIVVAEAQATGTPVIAYKYSGANEIVVEKKTGLYFNKQHSKDIKMSVEEFEDLEKQFDFEEISQNAKRFDEKFFQNQMSETILQKFKDFKK